MNNIVIFTEGIYLSIPVDETGLVLYTIQEIREITQVYNKEISPWEAHSFLDILDRK